MSRRKFTLGFFPLSQNAKPARAGAVRAPYILIEESVAVRSIVVFGSALY